MFARLNEPSTAVCFTHEGGEHGERPMSSKLQKPVMQSTEPLGSR